MFVCAHSKVVVELVLGVLGVCCMLIVIRFGWSVLFVCPQALAVCPQALRCVPSGWFLWGGGYGDSPTPLLVSEYPVFRTFLYDVVYLVLGHDTRWVLW